MDGGVPELIESEVERPTPESEPLRQEIFKSLEELKDKGHKFRMPNNTLALDKLKARFGEIQEKCLKKKESSPKLKPKTKTKTKTKRKTKSKPKPEPEPEPDLDYTSSDSDSDTDFEIERAPPPKRIPRSKVQSVKPMLHTIYYTGLGTGGLLMQQAGFDEFKSLGRLTKANEQVLDPILDDLAKEWGFDMGIPLTPEISLALITGSLIGACYIDSHPELPPAVRQGKQIVASFLNLNLAVSAVHSEIAKQNKE